MGEGGEAFGRRLGQEPGALVDGTEVLWKRSLPLHQVRAQWRDTICEPGSSPAADTASAGALTLGPPASRTEKSESVYKIRSLWYFALAAWMS